MTPQEKLAAELRAHASDCREAADLNTDVVLQFDQLAAMAEAMDSAAATLLSEQGEVTITTDASGRCVAVTRQDGEGRILSVIWEASEHGGGGEAGHAGYLVDGSYFYYADFPRSEWSKHNSVVPLYLHPPTPSAPSEYMGHPSGDGTIVRKSDPSRRLSVDEILAAMHGPSAPVVDDAMVERLAQQAYEVHSTTPVRQFPNDDHRPKWRAVVRMVAAALSGVSAPVGVEAKLHELADELKMASKREDEPSASIAYADASGRVRTLIAALTPPAAAPRVEDKEACPKCGAPTDPGWGHIGDCHPAASEDTPSRSRLRRIAAEKGEPAPRFDGGEDGLPEEIEAIVCPLEDDAAAMLERQPDDGTAHTMQAAAALIRRLAASGQGVRLGHRISLIQKGVRWNTLCDLIDSGDQNLYTILTDAMNMGAGALEMYVDEKIAAPTQEKGNG